MTIETGLVLSEVKSGKKGVITKIDKVAKTAIIEMEDGSNKAQCFTTFKDKRRWLPADEVSDDEYVEEVMQQKKDLGIECPKIDSYEVVVDHEPTSTPKEKKPCEGVGFDLKDLAINIASSMGADVCESASGKFISFKTGGKMFAAVFSFSKKSMTLGVRGKSVPGFTPTSVMNHSMDFRFTFDFLSDHNEKTITNILQTSMDYQLNKNNK